MYRKISLVDAEKVYIKTFGGFDLYYRGKEIDFSNAKAKELLAVLVDQGGREISLHEMAQILSDGEDDETARQAVHVAWSRLKKTLVSYGLGDIVRKGRGFYALNRRRSGATAGRCWRRMKTVTLWANICRSTAGQRLHCHICSRSLRKLKPGK